jgi:hypothetical protein
MTYYETLPYLAIGPLLFGAKASEDVGLCMSGNGVQLDGAGVCQPDQRTDVGSCLAANGVQLDGAGVCQPVQRTDVGSCLAANGVQLDGAGVCQPVQQLPGALLTHKDGRTRMVGPGVHRYLGDRHFNDGIVMDHSLSKIQMSNGCRAELFRLPDGTGYTSIIEAGSTVGKGTVDNPQGSHWDLSFIEVICSNTP